jgi:hypothetical protein
MTDHSIFGEAKEAGRRDCSSCETGGRGPNPFHGLFGARLFSGDGQMPPRGNKLPESRS